jgi:hypothetical protein
MDPDQTARMLRLVWIRAGHKRIMLVLSWRGSFIIEQNSCADNSQKFFNILFPKCLDTELFGF